MSFLVSNCRHCVHKDVCGTKPKYEKFIAIIEAVNSFANDSEDIDVVAECKHCNLEVS